MPGVLRCDAVRPVDSCAGERTIARTELAQLKRESAAQRRAADRAVAGRCVCDVDGRGAARRACTFTPGVATTPGEGARPERCRAIAKVSALTGPGLSQEETAARPCAGFVAILIKEFFAHPAAAVDALFHAA